MVMLLKNISNLNLVNLDPNSIQNGFFVCYLDCGLLYVKALMLKGKNIFYDKMQWPRLGNPISVGRSQQSQFSLCNSMQSHEIKPKIQGWR